MELVQRIPEPELMESPEQAWAYADADFSAPHDAFVARFRERFQEFRGGRAVDLGCGAADIAVRFARAFPEAGVHGVDGSAAMLELGEAHVCSSGLAGRISLQLVRLPVLDAAATLGGRYDAVITNSLLHHLTDPAVLWQTARAVAAPGAPIFVMDLRRPASTEAAEALVATYAADEHPTPARRLPRLVVRGVHGRRGERAARSGGAPPPGRAPRRPASPRLGSSTLTGMADRERTRYRLISGDSHVNEPPDLWTSRVPAEFVDRAPRIESFEQGDAWVLDGVTDPINFGMNVCAGLPPEEMTGWKRFDDIRRGGYDPAARLEEMDEDGVDAEVLYPTPRLSARRCSPTTTPTSITHSCRRTTTGSPSTSRTRPIDSRASRCSRTAAPTARSPRSKRVQDRPGIRGFVMGCYPNGTLDVEPEDDAVFGYLADAGIPLSIHVSLTQSMPSAHRSPLPGYGRFFDAPNRIVQLIFAGVFDRFPALCSSWSPRSTAGGCRTYKEQIDNNYQRLLASSDFTIEELPSVYVERNVHFTFITDPFGDPQPPRRRRRVHALVERLPAHQRRLAVLVALDPGRDVGRAARGAREDARRQRGTALRVLSPVRLRLRCAGGCRRGAHPSRPCRPTRVERVDHDEPLREPLG